MKFEEALAAMREGKKVKVAEWKPTAFIRIFDNPTKFIDQSGDSLELTSFDLLCENWEIYEEPKWEPQKGEYQINLHGTVVLMSCPRKNEFGVVRKTKQQAEKARDKMRTFNRLSAYVDEYAPDYEPDWSCKNARNYFLSGSDNYYYVAFDVANPDVAKVYMPEDIAIKLADDLNNGRVEL